jgi:sugar phosphate isomerase/epimerase
MPDWLPPLLTTILGGSIVIVGNLIVQAVKRNRADPPTWPEMWKKIEEMEDEIDHLKKAQATAERRWSSILATFLEQLRPGEVVTLHADDLEFIRHTLPPHQLARLRPKRG